MTKLPYSDSYMIYNNSDHHYILTEKCALESLGINLKERTKNEVAIKRVLRLASTQVYGFIHEHNTNNDLQDFIIAKTESGRKIIREAMEEQLLYLTLGGDISRVHDWQKQAMFLDSSAKRVLYRTIPEIGTTVCYTGALPIPKVEDGEW
jgi:hypothetical protein